MKDWTKLQVLAKDAAGKTVKGIHDVDDEVLIVYSDGTYSSFKAFPECFDGVDEAIVEEFVHADHANNPMILRQTLHLLIDVGVLTKEDMLNVRSIIEMARRKEDDFKAQLAEKAERDEYERLKAKFEPKEK